MSEPSIVVFGWGNPSRGDDALGLLLLDWLRQQPMIDDASISFVEGYQLQIEHALDLLQASQALFIDAHASCEPPFLFTQVIPTADVSYTSHALSPEALLFVCEQISHRTAPPSFSLGVRGERFDLGSPPTEAALSHLEQAKRFLAQLLASSSPENWSSLAKLNVRGG